MIPNITSYQLQLKKEPNIHQALVDSSELCCLKLMLTAYEMTQGPSMPHRHLQLLVKIQQENGVWLVEGLYNNKGGKFTYLLKSYILNYFNFISGASL